MAACSARTSSAEAARLSDGEERLLTKRSIECHRANDWETLFESEKAEKNKFFMIQTVTSLLYSCAAMSSADNMAERMLLEFAESGSPIFRATSPLSRGRLER